MIYGRVIGNELRDVPPECLPIWGQRWSGYRTPHGPSSFSTRIFSVDRMSELAPALTTPSQFEMALPEEDEGEDASSVSSQLHSPSPSSPLAIQAGAIEPTSQSETPTPHSFRRSSSQLHCSPNIRSNGHPSPPNSACISTTLSPRWQPEQSSIQHHASESLLHSPAFHHGTLTQAGRAGAFGNHSYDVWDSRAGFSHGSGIPSGQHIIPPHSIPEWQFANPDSQSPTLPFLPIPPSQHDNGHFLQPFQTDDQVRFTSTTPPSSSHSFTIPFPQQNVGSNSTWNHESSTSMIPGIAQPRNFTMSPLPSAPLQNSGSSLGPAVFYHSAPGHRWDFSHSEDWFGTFTDTEGCTLLSPHSPGGDQFGR